MEIKPTTIVSSRDEPQVSAKTIWLLAGTVFSIVILWALFDARRRVARLERVVRALCAKQGIIAV